MFTVTIRCWIDEGNYMNALVYPVCVSTMLNLLFLFNIVRVLLMKLRAGPAIGTRPSRSMLQAFRWYMSWILYTSYVTSRASRFVSMRRRGKRIRSNKHAFPAREASIETYSLHEELSVIASIGTYQNSLDDIFMDRIIVYLYGSYYRIYLKLT